MDNRIGIRFTMSSTPTTLPYYATQQQQQQQPDNHSESSRLTLPSSNHSSLRRGSDRPAAWWTRTNNRRDYYDTDMMEPSNWVSMYQIRPVPGLIRSHLQSNENGLYNMEEENEELIHQRMLRKSLCVFLALSVMAGVLLGLVLLQKLWFGWKIKLNEVP